ncbi:hypothetical protein [Paenibacillus sp. FSL P4-0288]|uniref:hypothetical protein n=1 Tax=Paenibacillus sp. FSL P4-0288 TaxID=2921633 RepID=UPI0030F5B7A6
MSTIQLCLFDIPDVAVEAPRVEIVCSEDLLSKFDAVIIENVSLITEEDRKVCESLQKDFNEAIRYVQMYLKFYNEHSCSNQYFRTGRLIENEEERLSTLADLFITDIVNHFRISYSITVEKGKFVNKYDYKVTYQEIVDEIILQLDGLNFKERAAEEIRNKIQSRIYRPEEKVKVKSNNIRISDFLRFDFLFSKPQNTRNDSLKDLLFAVEYFESESSSPREEFKNIYQGNSYRNDWFDEFIFESMNKFKSFKCFKNGSIQLKFASSELAVQFAKEYLKYTN